MRHHRGWALLAVLTGILVAGLACTLTLGGLQEESGQSQPSPTEGDVAEATTGAERGAAPGEAVVNIMDHGAVGDGVSSDGAAVDAALAATKPGGTLLLPPGRSFALPEPVLMNKAVLISGHGATVVKPAASGQVRSWFIIAADDVTVEGVTFSDPHNGVLENMLLASNGSVGVQVVRNTFTTRHPVAIRLVQTRDAVVEGNVIDGAREGIALSGPATDTVITGNEIRRWRNYGIHLFGTAEGAPFAVDITGNRVTDLAPGGYPRYPIHAEKGKSAGLLRDVSAVGNVVLGPGQSFTSGQGGTADQISMHSVDGVIVEGNVSRDGGDMGITVENCLRATVTGNVVTGSDVAGIAVFTGVRVAEVTDNTVLNNGQNRAGDRLPAGRAGIRLATSAVAGPSGVLVAENITGDTQQSKTQQYGVSIRATKDVVAGPNVDSGNAIRLYLDDADNAGLLVVRSGTPAPGGAR